MPTTHTLVIGAGQAGLAMSRCLTDAGIDHVVLERGRTAERWRSERWDSLRLLTPNWASRLPGWAYRGPHPDGYMTAVELAAYLTAYADSFDAPIEEGHDVRELVARRQRLHRAHLRHVVGGAQRRDGHRLVRPPARSRLRGTPRSGGRPDHPERLRQPGSAPGRAGARRRRRPPPACRSPTSSPAPAARSCWPSAATAAFLAATGGWTSGGGSTRSARSRRPSTTWTTRPRRATRARCSSSAASDHRDVDLPALQRLGVRVTGRLTGVDGDDLTFADDLRRHHGRRRRASPPAAGAHRRPHRRRRPRPRGPPRRHARPAARRRADHASARPSATASRRSSGPPATAAPTRGCGSRCSTPTARSSSGAASPPSPASTWSASAFSTGATRTSSTACATTPSFVARHIAGRVDRHPADALADHEDAS